MEYISICNFESFSNLPVQQISVDEKFSILFYKDSDGIKILDSSSLEFKKEFNHEKNILNGKFISDFTLYQYVHIKNKKENQLTIFNSKTKEILIYNYTESLFTYKTSYYCGISANYIFSIGDLLITFDKDYKAFNIGPNKGIIETKYAIDDIDSTTKPKILYVSNRNHRNPKENSFIVYHVNGDKLDAIYLEDEDKKLPIYVPNELFQNGIKFSDMKFASNVEFSSISFPFIAGISKIDEKFLLEIKNVFNERSTNQDFRNKYKSTRDAIPIELQGNSIGLSSSSNAFYYFIENSVFKMSLPSPDDLSILLKKDGLLNYSRMLVTIKNNEINSENIKNSDFLRFKSMIVFKEEKDKTLQTTLVDTNQISKVLSTIKEKNPKKIEIPIPTTATDEETKPKKPFSPNLRKTRSRNVLIIKNPQLFTKKRRNSSIIEEPEEIDDSPLSPTENLSYILKPTGTEHSSNSTIESTSSMDSNEEISIQHRIGRMKSSFSALEEGELSVKKGELIIILQDESDGWTLCFYKKKQGFIPSHYYFELDFKAFQKRKEIVKEFLETEETYVTNLIHLNHYFCVPLQKILSKKTHQTLFSNLQTVLSLNGLFLMKLQNISKKEYILQDDELSLILLEFSGSFRLYTEYIVSFESMNNIVLKEGSKNSKFEKFVKETKIDLKSKGILCDIGSYLILPVQRLPRYRMLLSDLLRVNIYPIKMILIQFLTRIHQKKKIKKNMIN